MGAENINQQIGDGDLLEGDTAHVLRELEAEAESRGVELPTRFGSSELGPIIREVLKHRGEDLPQ